ncbi:4Fe-4S dicluster domain-containing protein [Pseudodesulfovibrio sp.]|uniref:4Fe-4S dicluster domain-containing protein n=1 Tax=Pseudodesulfovibrio sp. TaxID=2035812 RepID=UPI002620F0C1|nr:4Fe-4S dicluster domain-containing protein [Pseudodesulfovibrio sp.]MDD3313151.1 4Fe-4S dicluster domain-containing protein [Pseudodesulfovibrio sp.]
MLFTPTVVKNLLKKPATRKYPFEVREPFPKYRGELVIDIDRCIFCSSCERKCPSQCIAVDRDKGTWQCDPYACIYCGYCVDVCPVKCLSMKDVHRKPSTEKTEWIEQGTPPRHKKKETPKDAAPKGTAPVLDKSAAAAEEAAPAATEVAPEAKAEERPAAKDKKKDEKKGKK